MDIRLHTCFSLFMRVCAELFSTFGPTMRATCHYIGSPVDLFIYISINFVPATFRLKLLNLVAFEVTD